MDRKILVIVFIMFLLSPIYSMSDDGGNVPVVQKENASKEVSQVEQQSNLVPDQITEEAKPSETVKDEFGIDTGMSKNEFEKFKQEYAQKFKKLFPGYKNSANESYFYSKIDINKNDIFKKYGLDIGDITYIAGDTYQKNTLYSNIIVSGEVVELQQKKDESFVPRYKLKIDKIIKGEKVIETQLKEIPQYLYFVAFLGMSNDNESILNRKGLYFLKVESYTKSNSLFRKRPFSTISVYNDSIVCYERDFNKFDSAFKYKHGKNEKTQKNNNYREKYLKWYSECKIGNWDETVNIIRKILEINDDKNFYKRRYISKEE